MDVLDFAIDMELDGRAYYKGCADHTENPHLRQIFLTLAEEEHRHYHIFKKMKAGEKISPTDLAPKGKTVATLKNVFREMVDKGKSALEGDTKREIWQDARTVEVKSEEMYREAAAETSDPEKKDMLNRIADEEHNHIHLIDNMLQFLADPAAFAASQDYRSFMSWEGK